MLQVAASARVSNIHGLGLFAEARIPAGTIVWRLEPPFDVVFTEAQLEILSEHARRQVLYYATYEATIGAHLLSGDDDRFINHSDVPNCRDQGDTIVALRDIEEGEEITLDYAELGYTFRSKLS